MLKTEISLRPYGMSELNWEGVNRDSPIPGTEAGGQTCGKDHVS